MEEIKKGKDGQLQSTDVFGGTLGVGEALSKLRTKLLDLTMRNRLLNFKHAKARSLQFTDEPDIDALYEKLEDGRAIRLLYVQDPPITAYEGNQKPEAKVYARELGIGTSTDLQKGGRARHANLQVIAYPSDLEGAAKKISAEARTAVEETGTNMLYLIFGFMEYFDSEDSETPALAPLLSMPVVLTKGKLDNETRTYQYDLTYSGDDIAENFTLREKLRQQFRLELPDFIEDDTPNSYIAKIEKAISKRQRWRVRRQLSLAFLSFGKLAIWADLDPEKSPELLTSPLLVDIFKGRNEQGDAGFHAEDYSIDIHPRAELPLVYDADSSQHSALIDVLDGKSLVINGPPGTGKSQTITNIIATAMAEGKKVLFVSEKMAALSVVKHRLERVGLGDFCLELHSNKTQKKQLLENIGQRLNRKFSSPSSYGRQLDVLRERKSALNKYADLLGSQIANRLSLTVNEVMWAVERRRILLGDGAAEFSGMVFRGTADCTPEVFDNHRQLFNTAASAIQEMGVSPQHSAWRGFSPELILPGDDEPIVETARNALAHATEMKLHSKAIEAALGVETMTFDELRSAGSWAAIVEGKNELIDEQLLAQLFSGDKSRLRPITKCYGDLETILLSSRAAFNEASKVLSDLSAPNATELEKVNQDASTVFSNSGRNSSLQDLGRLRRALQGLLVEAKSSLNQSAVIPEQPDELLSQLRGIHDGPIRAIAVERTSSELQEAAERVRSFAQTKEQALEQLSGLFLRNGLEFDGTVAELRSISDGTSFPELHPTANVDSTAIQGLKLLDSQGFSDWTSDGLEAAARDGVEALLQCKRAAQELLEIFERLALPTEMSDAWLGSIETLLKAAENAPMELLNFRTAGLGRADLVKILSKAEESQTAALMFEAGLQEKYHIDTLPEPSELRSYLAVFRRGDSLFNMFKSDWRRARNAFKSAYRANSRLKASQMAEEFASVLKGTEFLSAYESDRQLADILGPLFEGKRTDYSSIRRLSKWISEATAMFSRTDFPLTINAVQFSSEKIESLRGNASRIRHSISHVRRFLDAVHQSPALDTAIKLSRRFDQCYEPFENYLERLRSGAQLLRGVVRNSVSVSRAIALAELRLKLVEHSSQIQELLNAPAQLSQHYSAIGLPTQALGYENLKSSVETLSLRATEVLQASDLIAKVGVHLSLTDALSTLNLTSSIRDASQWMRTHSSKCSVAQYLNSLGDHCTTADAVLNHVAPRVGSSVSLEEALVALNLLHESELSIQSLDDREDVRQFLGPFFLGRQTDERAIEQCIVWANSVNAASQYLKVDISSRLLDAGCHELIASATRSVTQFLAAQTAYEEQLSFLVSWGEVDWEKWGGLESPSAAETRLLQALDGSRQLVPWSKFVTVCNECKEQGVAEVLKPFDAGRLEPSLLIAAFEYVFYRSIARAILSRNLGLGKFTGASHDVLRGEFADLDKEHIRLNGTFHAAQIDRKKKLIHGISHGRAGDLTELSLLTKEISKQKRHIPIRQLMKRAGKTLQELKPCFMMGPLSVAQYLAQGYLHFDLVVMDEASQLRPEDALGAVSRGTQLVVVGDPKQLPPTNFFDRLTDDDDQAELSSAATDGNESILGVCEHLYRPVRTLRWHYRSQHESLIAFSNSQFYEGRLVVFPAPIGRNSRLGVNYKFVKDGVYHDRRNLPEAEQVVDAILLHIKSAPEESLGVVTLNQTQRELIEDVLDRRTRNNTEVAEFFDGHKKAGWEFFIKNLENVQGDERDVIFISTTFGKSSGSTVVRRNFGPINRPDGWRRLNVLFTRARRRVDVFSSLKPSDVMSPDENASAGRKALHDYLVYAKTGMLPAAAGSISGKEPDSDFEISVAEALKRAGFDAEPQVGVAGYFIDIGVRHSSRPGEYLAAVECDGATYHSSLSARDRDRIRQEVLESLGWKGRIIRVWSTDWFSDPQAQTKRLIEFLHQRLKSSEARAPEPSIYELEQDEPSPPPTTSSELNTASANLSLFENPKDNLRCVDIGDRVTYLITSNEGEQKNTIQIVDIPSNPRLNLVNDATPLAQALIGLAEGDSNDLVVPGQATRLIKVISINS